MATRVSTKAKTSKETKTTAKKTTGAKASQSEEKAKSKSTPSARSNKSQENSLDDVLQKLQNHREDELPALMLDGEVIMPPPKKKGRPSKAYIAAYEKYEEAINSGASIIDAKSAAKDDESKEDKRPINDEPDDSSDDQEMKRSTDASTDGSSSEEAATVKKKSRTSKASKEKSDESYESDEQRKGDGSEDASSGNPSKTAKSETRSKDGNDQSSRNKGHQSNRADNQSSNQREKNQRNHSRQRQQRERRQQREYAPSVSKDSLAELKVPELREKAAELNIDASGMKKSEMIDAIYESLAIAEGFIEVEGILDIMSDGYGFLRTCGYLPSEKDVYVGLSTIRRNGLRKGDTVAGSTRPAREGEKFAAIQKVNTINGIPIEEISHRPKFSDLTPVYPDERLIMEHGADTITARVIDLAAPIGKGQRGLIVSPPKAGKTTVLKDIAASIHANNPEVHLMCLLVDERPEEVTDMQRSVHGEVVSSTFDMPSENHIAVAELVIERAKRLVEHGRDVVILLDSITRLARAYNLAQPASGRILSGGVDSTALYPPKRFLGAARNIENGGSLTILASALIDTGSKMDEVIFEEFKGTGNMELKLDRSMADRRIFPAIDVVSSGTRKEELLLDPQEAPLIWAVRRVVSNANSPERSTDMLIKSLSKTDNNQEFLIKTARRAKTERRGEVTLDI